MSSDNLRELIKKIKSDTTLTETEKNIQIQQLMSGNYLKSIKSNSNESKICSHYEKYCYKFYFECCNLYDPCKRCHGERNCISKDNLKVSKITCSICEYEQIPNKFCIQCQNVFSNSYCEICQIWTSKDITHCDKCGLCRLGKAENLFHCDDCGICFNKSDLEHKCANKSKSNLKSISNFKDGICVVCSENTFDSQSESFPMNCGHFIHQTCWTQYIQQGSYKCPYCKKSFGDLSSHWDFIRNQIKTHPLPNDFLPIQIGDTVDSTYGKFVVNSIITNGNEILYIGNFPNWNIGKFTKAQGILNSNTVKKNIYKEIHCNDCEKKSNTIYHPYGLECIECGSFNTQE